MVHRAVCSALFKRGLNISAEASPICRRGFCRAATLKLWNGTTVPYENQRIPMPAITSPALATPSGNEIAGDEQIQQVHRKYVEDLLHRAAASATGLDDVGTPRSLAAAKKRTSKSRTTRHSLSDPPHFRTDGPLTPYPIDLDSSEVLEPKHATLVRIQDKGGKERKIVVAEVQEGEGGKERRVLLAVDLEGYSEAGSSGAAPARQITAEDTYATLGLEADAAKR